MPKIVIREYDKTKAVGPEYASFAVVVPGFIGSTTDTTVFDKNGIYECSSRDDFVKNVNTAPNATVLVDKATGPTIDKTFGETPKELTEDEFTKLLAKGNLYVATIKGAEPVGKLVDETYTYEKVTANNGYVFKTEVVETPKKDEGTSTASEVETVNTLFAVLTNEGHNDIYETHYGNQIAYELLGLGYTVLYKSIETTADLTDSN
jgi:maltose-binding protein MalE